MIYNQAHLFLIFIVDGIMIGLLFDLFRILRKSFKTNDFFTYIEDILFWILTGLLLLYTIFIFNNGEIRLYMILGAILGTLIYMLFISEYIIKVNVKIILYIKQILLVIYKILIIPIKKFYSIIKKIFIKPLLFITINISDFSTKMINKSKIIGEKNKKNQKF